MNRTVSSCILAMSLLSIVAFTSTSAWGKCLGSNNAEWTIMIIMNGGSNPESEIARALESDILELAAVGSSQKINIVIQFDRGKETTRYFILPSHKNDSSRLDTSEPTGRSRALGRKWKLDKDCGGLASDESRPLGARDTIKSFLTETMTKFKAKHYALIIGSHGSGPRGPVDVEHESGGVRATGPDSTGKRLLNRQLREELEGAIGGKKLDLIGFDSCLMATLEVAYAARRSAHYMVASQALERGAGWDYTILLERLKNELKNTKQTDGSWLGKHILNAFNESLKSDSTANAEATLSVIKLGLIADDTGTKNKPPGGLTVAVSKLGEELTSEVTTKNTKETEEKIAAARGACPKFGYKLNEKATGVTVDLHCFADEINLRFQRINAGLSAQAGVVRDLIKEAISDDAYVAGVKRERARGLSIYFPGSRPQIDGDYDRDGYLGGDGQPDFVTDTVNGDSQQWVGWIKTFTSRIPTSDYDFDIFSGTELKPIIPDYRGGEEEEGEPTEETASDATSGEGSPNPPSPLL